MLLQSFENNSQFSGSWEHNWYLLTQKMLKTCTRRLPSNNYYYSVIDRILCVVVYPVRSCTSLYTAVHRPRSWRHHNKSWEEGFVFVWDESTNPDVAWWDDSVYWCKVWMSFLHCHQGCLLNVTDHNNCIRKQLEINIHIFSSALWSRMYQFYAKFTKMRVEVLNYCVCILQSETRLDV
jgi:hypothetical protein